MQTNSYRDELLETFQWFHRHPELSYEEVETTKKLKALLTAKGITVLDTGLATGLVAQVGTGKQPVIAIRCDIDGLPITEEADVPYISTVPGKMHGCGHDFHTTAVLGAAYLLKEKEAELPGTVKILFQPAEEAPGGALDVIKTGVLDDVQRIFGLHVTPAQDVGTVGLRSGADSAAVDAFKFTFIGKGAHAAHPELGIDPIVIATNFINAVQTVVSRTMNAFAPGVVSVTHIAAGNTWNVIPETAFVEGTARTTTPENRALVRSRIVKLAEDIAGAYGATVDTDWYAGPPATNNAPELEQFVAEVAREAGLTPVVREPSLGGEDFAYYEERIKGVFFHIGTGRSYSLHNPKFKVDPAALYPAARFMAQLAQKVLADPALGVRHD